MNWTMVLVLIIGFQLGFAVCAVLVEVQDWIWSKEEDQ